MSAFLVDNGLHLLNMVTVEAGYKGLLQFFLPTWNPQTYAQKEDFKDYLSVFSPYLASMLRLKIAAGRGQRFIQKSA